MVAKQVLREASEWLRGQLAAGPVRIVDIEYRGIEQGYGRLELLAAALHINIKVFGAASNRMWELR